MNPLFVWDEDKAQGNLRKHRVSFEEAISIFTNPLAAIVPDPDHSEDEVREIIVGHSERNRVLIVSFTEREELVRIISARVATTRERKLYEDNRLGGQDK